MNKSLKQLMLFLNCLLIILSIVLITISYAFSFFSVQAYNILFYTLVISLSVVISAVLTAQILFVSLYKGKRVTLALLRFIFYFMRAATPVFIQLSKLLGYDKNAVRRLFVDVNNQVVETKGIKYKSEDVIILVPHCLQYSECGIKLTNHSSNCKRCGRCCIGEIIDTAEHFKVPVFVMSGGTAARNTVSRMRPKLIVSVACERDLATGIMDVGKIPVIGIENDRPNGPCFNTRVDTEKIRNTLEKILDENIWLRHPEDIKKNECS